MNPMMMGNMKEMIEKMMNSDMCKEMAPKMMPEMMPKALDKFLLEIPEDKREEFIKNIVDIIVSKNNDYQIYSKYEGNFNATISVKGLKLNSKGGKGATKETISPMDLFLSGLCGCIAIAVGRTLSENNIDAADVTVKVSSIEKSFEKGCVEKIALDIIVNVDNKDNINEEELKELVLNGSKKCLISNSLNCEIEKNVIIR